MEVDPVVANVQTAFEAMKQIFAIDFPQSLHQIVENAQRTGGAPMTIKDLPKLPQICVSVCGMGEMTSSLGVMRDTLGHLHTTLVTLQYCILVLTVVLTLSIICFAVLGTCFVCIRLRQKEMADRSEVSSRMYYDGATEPPQTPRMTPPPIPKKPKRADSWKYNAPEEPKY